MEVLGWDFFSSFVLLICGLNEFDCAMFFFFLNGIFVVFRSLLFLSEKF